MNTLTSFAELAPAVSATADDRGDRSESLAVGFTQALCEGDGNSVESGPARRILVVDDDPATRMICAINLEAEGFSVLEAADGREGLERARSEHPDLVLTDVVMPGLDGFGLAEALQRDEDTRGIPVVFMTGFIEQRHEARARELGAFAFLKKPFDPETLVSVALQRFRLGPIPPGPHARTSVPSSPSRIENCAASDRLARRAL